MFDQLIALALMICGAALAVTTLVNIGAAAVYDVRAARQRRVRLAQPQARRYRHRPLVTVIVMARNDAESIGRCLDSLRRGSYRKLQVIIVDNASQDATAQTVRTYLAGHPKLAARLVAKRRPAPWAQAARQAYRRYGRGELVVLLNADSGLDRQAVRRTADQAADRPDSGVFLPRLRPSAPGSLGGLLQTYLTLLQQRSGKAGSVLHKQPVVSANGLACRQTVFNQVLRQARGRAFSLAIAAPYAYRHDVIVNTPAVGSYYRVCRELYRAPFNRLRLSSPRRWGPALLMLAGGLTLLLVPLLSTYFIFLALSLKEPLFLVLSLGGLSLLLASAIWEDEQLGLRRRLAYSLGIPVTYSLFYGLAWVRLAAACRAIAGRRRLAT